MARKKIIAGNWKMHGSLNSNLSLLAAIKQPLGQTIEIAVCVPFPYLPQVQQILTGSSIMWGAQNLSEYTFGAYTGEVAGEMLNEFGCRYVIVGHSERRTLFAESNTQVAAKFVRAQQAGLIPILCVGETLAQREAEQTATIVSEQLDAVLTIAGIEAFTHAVIAYEPVWAIGTGKTATPDQAQEIHAFIRQRLAQYNEQIAATTRIQYGGSMKPSNAQELLSMPDIDGGLIGGAALIAQDFLAICQAARSD